MGELSAGGEREVHYPSSAIPAICCKAFYPMQWGCAPLLPPFAMPTSAAIPRLAHSATACLSHLHLHHIVLRSIGPGERDSVSHTGVDVGKATAVHPGQRDGCEAEVIGCGVM